MDGAGRGYVFPIALGKMPQNQDGPRSSPCRPDGHRSSGWSITPDSGQVKCLASSTNFSPLVLPGILHTFKHHIFPMKLIISFHLPKLLNIKSEPFHLSGYCGCFLEARSRPPSRQWPPLVALGALCTWQGSACHGSFTWLSASRPVPSHAQQSLIARHWVGHAATARLRHDFTPIGLTRSRK